MMRTSRRHSKNASWPKQSLPSIALVYNDYGLVLETLERLEPAAEAYLKAVLLNPQYSVARQNLRNARIKLEEEEYRHTTSIDNPAALDEMAALAGSIPEDLTSEDDFPDLDAGKDDQPAPGWVYLDEKAFLLAGWPGHRIRPGRSGYDPLDTYLEEAHINGVVLRLLFTQKLITLNPISLLMMLFVSFFTVPPFICNSIALLNGEWISLILWSLPSRPGWSAWC